MNPGEPEPEQRVTIDTLRAYRAAGRKIVVLTAYDAPFASLAEQAGADILMVGDSLGMAILGYPTTVPVTLDQMLHHAAAVCRVRRRAMVIGDMPFGSYNSSERDAIISATRFIKEAGVDAVKVEGGAEVAPTIKALVRAGIAVMGHVGVLPQLVAQQSSAAVQGATRQAALKLIRDCRAVEEAGVFCYQFESVPRLLAREIVKRSSVPVLGIGAGEFCDGQILITHDVVGLFQRPAPRFVKRYADLSTPAVEALKAFSDDVRQGRFPEPRHSFVIGEEIIGELFQSEEARGASSGGQPVR